MVTITSLWLACWETVDALIFAMLVGGTYNPFIYYRF